MKGLWEPNISVWFPFMFSQKWNCYFQNRIIMFCLPVPTLIYLWKIYKFSGSVCLFCCREICGVDQSWENINHSQTHECGNCDWGRAIPRKGIQKWDFPCSVLYNTVQSWCSSALFSAFPMLFLLLQSFQTTQDHILLPILNFISSPVFLFFIFLFTLSYTQYIFFL